jgi:hypothetical protein
MYIWESSVVDLKKIIPDPDTASCLISNPGPDPVFLTHTFKKITYPFSLS